MSRGQLVAFPTPPEAGSGAPAAGLLRRRRDLERALGRQREDEEGVAREPGVFGRRPGGERASSVPSLTLTLILAVVLGVGLFCRDGGVAELPAAERARVYAQTLASLQTACIPPHSWSPSDYCREQIRNALEFPECGAECRALVNQAGHRPTK